MQTSVMLCALLDTPVCGISRGEEILSFVDLSVLRGLGRSRVALDDHLLMSMEAQYATVKLLRLSVDKSDLNRNPYAIDFINTDLTLAPANFEENVITPQRLQFFRRIELTLGCLFKAFFETSAIHLLQVEIPATVRRGLNGSHEGLYGECDVLFACELASVKGLDVDQPRNLAKSVTVE